MSAIAILGAGAMGAALAAHLSREGRGPALLATEFDAEASAAMRDGRPHPGLGLVLPPLRIVDPGDWDAELRDAEIVVPAVSTAGLVGVIERVAPAIGPSGLYAVATKGWDSATMRSAASVAADAAGDPKRVVALVGPSLAVEIAAGVPTGMVAACEHEDAAMRVAEAFSSPRLRVYTSTDVAGVEVGAALKNVVAIAAGLCDGIAEAHNVAWTNTKAFVFARGLAEMATLCRAVGGRPETILGLTGAGDLFVTTLGGRNARFGRLVGSGVSPPDALAQLRTTVEGYENARSAAALARAHGLDLPIVNAVHAVLHEGRSALDQIAALLDGPVRAEW
ncbi:MAG: NAD(P)H-dependent glycerol-3-phosphate dehydrogenase [Actinomycetota bacterium]